MNAPILDPFLPSGHWIPRVARSLQAVKVGDLGIFFFLWKFGLGDVRDSSITALE